MDEKVENILGMIVVQIKADKNITRITRELLEGFVDDFRVASEGRRRLSTDERGPLLRSLVTYYSADLSYENDFVSLERGRTIVDKDPRLHDDWSPNLEKRFFWKKQRGYLMPVLGKKVGDEEAAKIINSIDFETEAILTNMEDPIRHKFDSRGLTVGYVQSGKTANFTALISKAADAGYRFFIVLAGIHDELRQQTQIRIDRELTGHNNLSLKGSFVEWNDLEEPRRWYNLTSAGWLEDDETGEFTGKGINKFVDIFLNRQRPVIAIVKKNVKVMDKLIRWIDASSEETRRNVPVMIIDDEADQASVDGNANRKDTDPTATNECIRRILKCFSRTAYIGYTATPFANVFIKHNAEHDSFGDDLYPRNFIHALPEPPGYFGTRRIFADDLDEEFVIKVHNPLAERKAVEEKETIEKDLTEAIYSFLVCVAIRNLRGQGDQPMSMMININHTVSKMNRVGHVIQSYIQSTIRNHLNIQILSDSYQNIVKSAILINGKLGLDNNLFDVRAVVSEVRKFLSTGELKVKTLNSKKEDKLDYARSPAMKVIAIGGNKLSRGLTLEGLMTTFYLRESRQFDTLLQMGRWFGYRKGYEDLVRIYTSEKLWKIFKDLAIVELQFRDSIKSMIEAEKTPR